MTSAYKLLCESPVFIVLDTETTPGEGRQHVVSIAAATWKRGRSRGLWARLVDPGIPITNSHIHHLTDEDVAGKPMFSELTYELDEMLAADGVVLVCHNAGFDVAVLRAEYEAAGRTLPDVLVLDTRRLPAALNYEMATKSTSLKAMCEHFGIQNLAEHDAAADVQVTADLLHRLLRIAAQKGVADFADVARVAGCKMTSEIKAADKTTRDGITRHLSLPAEHVTTHTALLPIEPSSTEIRQWINDAIECARLRCPLLADKVNAAMPSAHELHPRLTTELRTKASELQPGQGATLVGALNMLAKQGIATKKTLRPYVTWWQKNRDVIAELRRCSSSNACPDCVASEPCPIDVAHHPIAEAFLIENGAISRNRRDRFWEPDKRQRSFFTWVERGLPELAGYGAWLVVEAYGADGLDGSKWQLIDDALRLGCGEPRLIRLAAERSAALQRHDVVTEMLTELEGRRTTDPGWSEFELWHRRYRAHLMHKPRRPQHRPDVSPRNARPVGRVRLNRFVASPVEKSA